MTFAALGSIHAASRRLRGAMVSLGLLTASAGNMAQGVAYCARRLAVPATVVATGTASAATSQPCDIYAAAGTPCGKRHSTPLKPAAAAASMAAIFRCSR